MKTYLRTFAKTAVAIFFAWHVVAVGAYTIIPAEVKGPVATWVRTHVQPRVVRYVLITSQWQQWNLFSPNPLRRIVYYRVETRNAINQWAYVASVNNNTYGVWRHAVRFKLLGQALEENTDRPELAERAAQVFCREFELDRGAGIRIWHDLTIVPYVVPYPGTAWWNEWTPQFTSTLAIETQCD